jgi:hypothetical protein
MGLLDTYQYNGYRSRFVRFRWTILLCSDCLATLVASFFGAFD